MMSTTLAVSPAVPRVFGLSSSSSTPENEKEVNPFDLLTSNESTSRGNKRKHAKHSDRKRSSKRPSLTRSTPKIRIVRTTSGYRAFPVIDPSPEHPPQISTDLPLCSSSHPPIAPIRIIRTLQGYEVVPSIADPCVASYANKLRIVRTKDGQYKAFPAPSTPLFATKSTLPK